MLHVVAQTGDAGSEWRGGSYEEGQLLKLFP